MDNGFEPNNFTDETEESKINNTEIEMQDIDRIIEAKDTIEDEKLITENKTSDMEGQVRLAGRELKGAKWD